MFDNFSCEPYFRTVPEISRDREIVGYVIISNAMIAIVFMIFLFSWCFNLKFVLYTNFILFL